jgi:hypothetical protein
MFSFVVAFFVSPFIRELNILAKVRIWSSGSHGQEFGNIDDQINF